MFLAKRHVGSSLPDQGIELTAPALEQGVLAPGPASSCNASLTATGRVFKMPCVCPQLTPGGCGCISHAPGQRAHLRSHPHHDASSVLRL